ncbi:hypothetical protein [Caulobacter sp. NIBR1757]|uniref:hypothetical protein n=1 Tax=Caulobacter sp. NIBR1757 TaxID=3016000 RepID=UPI0022F06A82|nr:hypothetical protein [Caulobacter sp. NIBR1757]WGM38917.1 hypothetical protein AMEJIAPC_01827 [Caulobacter sp. NIBR1757]
MDRRALLAFVPALLAATAAQASGGGEKKKDSAGQYVDLAPIALPVVVGGKLINYIFVALRLNLTPSADSVKLRAKEPWFRDAMVRAGHRQPFTNPKNYLTLDEARLKSVLLREAGAIAGPKNFTSVTITSMTPKQRSGLPRPPA